MKKMVLNFLMALALAGIIVSTGCVTPPAEDNTEVVVDDTTEVDEEVVLTVVAIQTKGFVNNFNPFNLEVGYRQARDWIYAPLYIFNLMDSTKDFPWLATDMTYSEDLKTLTVKLRDDIKWSDGENFTADDVVFTAMLKKEYPKLIMHPYWDTEDGGNGILSGVEKVDDYTVNFYLKEANSLAHMPIGELYTVPEHIWSKLDDPVAFQNENPVGNGPFTEMTDFQPTGYSLKQNPYYFMADELDIDVVKFPQYDTNEELLNAAANGDVDWIGCGVSNAEEDLTGRNTDMKYWFVPESVVNLQLNTTRKPFDNLEFRKAMTIAIDREALHEATYGLSIKATYPIGLGDFYKSWYDHDRLGQYKYLMEHNMELAAEILDNAGFVDQDGDGWRDNLDGSELTFDLSVPATWTDWVNSMEVIANNLQAIGVNAILDPTEEGEWFGDIASANFDVYIMWGLLSATPWDAYWRTFNPDNMKQDGMYSLAIHQMKLPKMMDLLDEFSQTVDAEAKRDIMGQAQELVAQNLPIISLFSNPSWYEYSTARFEGWVTKDNPYAWPVIHPGNPARVVVLHNLKPKAN